MNSYFIKQGIDQPEILWFLRCQFLCVVSVLIPVSLIGTMDQSAAFAVGALLASLNLFALARLVPQLIWLQNGAVFTLLVSFYSRLLFTAVILFIALVFLKLSAVFFLIGFSTVVVTLILGIGKYIFTLKHEKEA